MTKNGKRISLFNASDEFINTFFFLRFSSWLSLIAKKNINYEPLNYQTYLNAWVKRKLIDRNDFSTSNFNHWSKNRILLISIDDEWNWYNNSLMPWRWRSKLVLIVSRCFVDRKKDRERRKRTQSIERDNWSIFISISFVQLFLTS